MPAHSMRQYLSVAAAALSVLTVGPALAQAPAEPPQSSENDAATAAPPAGGDSSGTAGEADRDPHQMLDSLHGGPAGSPTARRSNPRPGTSTSIPTTHPATVTPLDIRRGADATEENTGIDGQCDPVVGLGNCPERPR